jgi:hypothetical protein
MKGRERVTLFVRIPLTAAKEMMNFFAANAFTVT